MEKKDTNLMKNPPFTSNPDQSDESQVCIGKHEAVASDVRRKGANRLPRQPTPVICLSPVGNIGGSFQSSNGHSTTITEVSIQSNNLSRLQNSGSSLSFGLEGNTAVSFHANDHGRRMDSTNDRKNATQLNIFQEGGRALHGSNAGANPTPLNISAAPVIDRRRTRCLPKPIGRCLGLGGNRDASNVNIDPSRSFHGLTAAASCSSSRFQPALPNNEQSRRALEHVIVSGDTNRLVPSRTEQGYLNNVRGSDHNLSRTHIFDQHGKLSVLPGNSMSPRDGVTQFRRVENHHVVAGRGHSGKASPAGDCSVGRPAKALPGKANKSMLTQSTVELVASPNVTGQGKHCLVGMNRTAQPANKGPPGPAGRGSFVQSAAASQQNANKGLPGPAGQGSVVQNASGSHHISRRKSNPNYCAPGSSSFSQQTGAPHHLRWRGFGSDPPMKPVTKPPENCPLCKRDLRSTPTGSLPHPHGDPPMVAVLPCGHVFHDHCLSFVTGNQQSTEPPCIPCATGKS